MITAIEIFKIMNRGSEAKGFENRLNIDKALAREPIIIRKAKLSPTESNTVSMILNFSNLNNLKIKYPGIIVKKRNPEI